MLFIVLVLGVAALATAATLGIALIIKAIDETNKDGKDGI